MSRLEQLINDLCPDGVEYKTLGNCLIRTKGTKITAEQMQQLNKENAPVKIFAGGKTVAYFDYDDLPENDIQTNPSIIVKSRGLVEFEYYDKPFSHKNEFWAYHSQDEHIDIKYVFYYLKNEELFFRNVATSMGSLPQISIPDTENFKIPLPPRPVQEEIVRILDNFTELTAELTAELKAEFTARKTQYEYYRDNLLNNGTGKKTLKEILLSSRSGGTPLKSNKNYYEKGSIPWLRTQEVVFNEIYRTDCFITELAVQETSAKWVPANCVIIAISGASAGRCAINKIPLTTNQHCLSIEIDPFIALYKFVFYCVCNQYEELVSKKEGARGDLNASRILSLKIPVPSIEEQEQIVEVLDRFDALSKDISKGLHAEIKARQQQYEYYRDKLLTFKEKEVSQDE